jgi:hypothetical protein
VRVAPDPHYGLPMVTCPRCGATAVRRRDPVEARLRSTRRVLASLSTLGLQIVTLILFMSLVTVVCNELRIEDVERVLRGEPRPVAEVFYGLLVVPIAVGAWLTAGLGHWPRWAAWAAFFLLALAVVSINVILEPLVMRTVLDHDVRWAASWSLWQRRAGVLAVIVIVATMGIPIGRLCRGMHAGAVRWLWRARRRRLRERSLQ